MTKRRDILKLGLTTVGAGLASKAMNAGAVPQSGLVFPQTFRPSIHEEPSPAATPFVAPLFRMPIAQPVSASSIVPSPVGLAHQRYDEFLPKKFYTQVLSEFRWRYHPEPPYNQGSWTWGFNGMSPGETFHANYGEPILVRRINNLPVVGAGNIKFALPSTSIHLHNGHTASESDGIPQDYFDSGYYWDYHYANFPAGNDPREAMSTLWYHDHRLDFTGPNVYAGLTGFYLLFDELDSNNERDKNRHAFRLPSGEYDIPLILHDIKFDKDGQAVWDFSNPNHADSTGELGGLTKHNWNNYTTNGMLGDRFTVNRTIQPFLKVERRKYRFRILNGGPSRLYNLSLQAAKSSRRNSANGENFIVISTDGNLLPEPIVQKNIEVWVAQRHDVIVDFSNFRDGDQIYLVNHLEMKEDGTGPTGRDNANGDFIMRFDVVPVKGPDLSKIPDTLRELPPINMSLVRKERLFVFDYNNGLWTINGRLMDPNRVDAAIEQGSAEIWTLRNEGNSWVHPIHTHFEEFQILEINGKPVRKGDILKARKDVVSLGPNMEMKFYSRWRDFLGKHVMHCHNVVHEDHSMMIRWDIVPPGMGD